MIKSVLTAVTILMGGAAPALSQESVPHPSIGAAGQSGYGWQMGDWMVGALHATQPDLGSAASARAQVGRALHFAEAPIATLGGAACSFPRYHAEPSPGPEFGDLSEYPAAVMVRVTCVGIALLDVVRLTDDRVLLGEGGVVFEL